MGDSSAWFRGPLDVGSAQREIYPLPRGEGLALRSGYAPLTPSPSPKGEGEEKLSTCGTQCGPDVRAPGTMKPPWVLDCTITTEGDVISTTE